MTILKLMIVRYVTGYFLPRYPTNIYPFLGQNVAKMIGYCEPGKRSVEEASEKSCNCRVVVFCNPCKMSFHFIWPASNILCTQSLKEKTTKTERKIWNYNLITSSQQTTHNAAAPHRILFWRSFHFVFSSTFLLIIFSCRLSQQILCLWPRRYAYANIRARYSFLSLLWRNPFSYEHAHTHTETCPDKKDYAPCLDKWAKGKHLVRSSEFAWQLRVDRFPLRPFPVFLDEFLLFLWKNLRRSFGSCAIRRTTPTQQQALLYVGYHV